MVRVDEVIAEAEASGQRRFSFEFLPPKRYQEMDTYMQKIDSLVEFGPAWITFTYHQERLIERDGVLVPHKLRAGSDVIAAHFSGRYKGMPVVPHLICGSFTREETERALIQLPYAEIENVFCIRGDENTQTKKGMVFTGKKGGHLHASGLVKQVADQREAVYVRPDAQPTPLDFCIGVAGYPESHHESESLDDCLHFAKMKQDLGANYIITQICFDTETILRYRDQAIKAGIHIPIVPGLKVLDSKAQLNSLPRLFHIRIPDKLARRVEILNDTVSVGQNWALEQARALYEEGFPTVHFYTMNRMETMKGVLEQLST